MSDISTTIPMLIMFFGIVLALAIGRERINKLELEELIVGKTLDAESFRIKNKNQKQVKDFNPITILIKIREQKLEELLKVTGQDGVYSIAEANSSFYRLITIAVLFIGINFIFLKNTYIYAAIAITCLYAYFRPQIELKSAFELKSMMFTDELPNFIMNINMAISAGMDVTPAMENAIQTLTPMVQEEFARVVNESKYSPDNLEEIYSGLANRIKTDEVRTFTNTILTGLRNGSSMEKIFKSEANRLKKIKITNAKIKGDKAENSATLLSTALVLMPGVVLIMLPFLLS